MYNIFDHRIVAPNLRETALFYHEYYHHVQNISTVLGGERLNLITQFLAHTTNLAAGHEPLYAPFNRWYEEGLAQGFATPKLRQRLENLVFHQDEWLYLDKILYRKRVFREGECYDEHLATVKNKEKEALEPYLLRSENGETVGYPVGGFTITESGAYSLELWHSPDKRDPAIFKHLNEGNYQYLIVLERMYQLLGDFRLACLATFLLCDLAMIISTPSMGFLALYQTVQFLFKKGMDEEALLKWYYYAYETFSEEITQSVRLEVGVIQDIRRVKQGLNRHINNMFEWQLNPMEKGLMLRMDNRTEFIHRLLSGKQEDTDYLLKAFPLTLIETTDDGKVYYNSEEEFTNYELLNVTGQLFLGLCRNVRPLVENPDFIHLKKEDDTSFILELQTEGSNTDAYGLMLQSMGLSGKRFRVLEG
ncbi:MAG: hypothetical protein JNK77_17230 [Saprospiraceae bacterium]|nr:hypothetical protein [Saprospiraceae bacterium]